MAHTGDRALTFLEDLKSKTVRRFHEENQELLEFRRSLMTNHPKHLAVLNAAAEKGDWGKPLPAGVHRGIAQFMGYGSYSAATAEVSVSPQGKLKIEKSGAPGRRTLILEPARPN